MRLEYQGGVFLKADFLANAEKEYQRLIETQPDSPMGYMGLIQIASYQRNWEFALQLWDTCLARFPDLTKPQGLLAKLQVLLELGKREEADVLSRDLVAAFPDYFGGYYGSALVAEAFRDWAGAGRHLDTCLARFPGLMDAEWRAYKAHLLMRSGCLEAAEQLLQEVTRRYPGCPEAYIKSAKLAELKFDRPLTYERWEKAYRLFPEHKECAYGYIDSLNDQGEFEAAHSLCEERYEKTGDIGFKLRLVDCFLAQMDFDAALETAAALIKSYPDNLEPELKRIDALMGCWRQEQADQAVRFAEELYARFPDSHRVRLKLIDSCIHAGRIDRAREQLESLPIRTGEAFETKKLRSWLHVQNGDIDKAREVFLAATDDAYLPALHAPFNLKRIDRNRIDPRAEELFLFSCVKDSVHTLPWLLNYYRKIGVERFFIVDNDSSDGTSAFLLEQPDVHLFWSDDAFYTTASGLRWINHLIGEYGEGHWCILADSDEILVVPGVEKRGVKPLLEYMQRNGHEALSVFLLDMFPETVAEFSSFPSDGNLLEHSPYFDNSLRYFGNSLCPYRFVRGGVRERLFEGIEVLEKVAVIKGGGDIRFLNPHSTTPAILSDVTGVYLHFTLVQKPQLSHSSEQIINDSRIGGRSGASRKRYSRYHRLIAGMAKDRINYCPDSSRYLDSDQLVELGLIARPAGFPD